MKTETRGGTAKLGTARRVGDAVIGTARMEDRAVKGRARRECTEEDRTARRERGSGAWNSRSKGRRCCVGVTLWALPETWKPVSATGWEEPRVV